MTVDKPRVMIAIEDKDAMVNIAGLLWFKGYEVYKSNSAEECTSKINELKDRNMHVVILSQQVALDRRAMLIVKVKKTNIDTKVLVIADEDNEKTRILDYGAD